jgi:hypothetical protein
LPEPPVVAAFLDPESPHATVAMSARLARAERRSVVNDGLQND